MIQIINTTPHAIVFDNPAGTFDPAGLSVKDRGDVTVTIPPSGVLINARPIESHAGQLPSGIELVRTRFEADPASEAALSRLERDHPGAIIVGSIIAAQAFPGRVLAMVPAPGFERVPPDQKRMRLDRFTTF